MTVVFPIQCFSSKKRSHSYTWILRRVVRVGTCYPCDFFIQNTCIPPKSLIKTLFFFSRIFKLTTIHRSDKDLIYFNIIKSNGFPAYFDFPGLQRYVDHYTLMIYDFRNPFRLPKLADYASPFQYVYADRKVDQNIEWRVNKTIEQGIDRSKIVLGIATFGRTWKLDADTDKTGVPPLKANGPADGGTYTETEGLLAYYEICPHLVESTQALSSLTMLR